MPTTNWIPNPAQIADGTDVSASTVNTVLAQLIQREQYLYEAFGAISGKSALTVYNQAVHPSFTSSAKLGSLVYFLNDGVNSGLALSQAAYTSSGYSSFYAPNNSSFVFGVIQNIYASGSGKAADLAVDGLITLPVNIDDPVNGMLDSSSSFAVGPYYLSNVQAGKLTQVPIGVTVYVGYAISRTQFILGANVEEFAQFFTQYKFDILDRPIGTPLDSAGTWTIPSPDVSSTAINRVGWLPVASIPTNIVPAASVPAGAKFFYGLPAALLSSDPTVVAALDNPGISTDEKNTAIAMAAAMPPFPYDFTFLYVNGIAQSTYGGETPNGSYTIDQYGLWWYADLDPYQPWASDLVSLYGSWTAAEWVTKKGTDSMRPHMKLQFVKFNPALRQALVSSIAPYVDTVNDTSTAVTLVSKDIPTQTSKYGDLLLKLVIGSNVTSEIPVTAGAVKSVSYNQLTGKLDVVKANVVTSISGSNGINATYDPATGAVALTNASTGLTGSVDSLEPVNAALKYTGLNSYLNLVDYATLPSGVMGKFVLPTGIVPNDLYLVMYMFGKSSTASLQSVSFNFSYAVTNTGSVINTSVLNGANPIVVNFPAAVYTGYTQFSVQPFSIPQSYVTSGAVVNFSINRTTSVYSGDIGILNIYWKLGV